MEVILDANILFAGLMKASTTALLLFDPHLKLYTPEFILEEFMNYSSLIQKKMKRTHDEFVMIRHQLHQVITVVPQEEYEQYVDKAKTISPDDKDVMYFALALKMKCGIWSNDKKLKEQDQVIVYDTGELLDHLNK